MKVTNTGWSAAAFGLLRKADGSKQDAAGKTQQNELSKAQQDALDRLGKWQEAMQKLNKLPTAQESKKANAQAKINELQRRLMDLKQLLLHATPQMAKALIAELKSIAGELGSAAKALADTSGSGSGASQVSVTVTGGASTDAAAAESGTAAASAEGAAQAAQAQADQAGQAAEAQADQAAQAAEAQAGQAAAATSGQATQAGQDSQNASQNAGQAEGARALGGNGQSSAKDALEEAKRLLKEVLSMMKAKLANAPKADRDRLHAVENSLDEISQAQAAMSGPDLYSSLGTGVGDISASVPSIDITA